MHENEGNRRLISVHLRSKWD